MVIRYFGKRVDGGYWNFANRSKWYLVSLSVLFFLVVVTPKTFVIESEAQIVIQKPLAVLVEDLKKEPEPNPDIREKISLYAKIYGVDEKLAQYITFCESSHQLDREGDIIKGVPHAFGLWQIWPEYHPEVSKKCAKDFHCSTEWSMKKLAQGQYKLWTCGKRYYEN